MDNRTLFTGKAADYAAARPSYAPALIDILYARHGFSPSSRIADVGAGTGKFSELLVKRGSTVYAVEPNDDMRAYCLRNLNAYPNFYAVAGDAANTGLPAGSVDIVTTAQAFHWFDPVAFRVECVRLTGGGMVAVVYNRHGEGGIYAEISAIAARYRSDREEHRRSARAAIDVRIEDFFDGRFVVASVCYPIVEDEETFLRHRLSSSGAPREGEAGYQGFCADMRDLFARHAKSGSVTLENDCVAWVGTVF